MEFSRSRLCLVALALGVAGVVGGGWAMKSRAAHPTGSATIPAAMERIVHFERAEAETVVATENPDVDAVTLRMTPVAQLSGDAAAQFAALCELRLLAADTELDLSHREWARLAEAVRQAQAVRLAYEAEIGRAEEMAPGRFRVEIPAYAAAGDELRRRFEADLREKLSASVAAEVWEKMGAKLEGVFAGFGVSTQTLEIVGDPARAPADVTVQRMARYWNSTDGSERVTTRSETHWPGSEDPAGETWSPLLALVSKAE